MASWYLGSNCVEWGRDICTGKLLSLICVLIFRLSPEIRKNKESAKHGTFSTNYEKQNTETTPDEREITETTPNAGNIGK